MINVLIASSYVGKNSYVKNLVDALVEECHVVTGIEPFWASNMQFDIIHIQYPEELFNWDPFYGENGLERLAIRLDYWQKRGAKLVVTVHDEKSHRGKNTDQTLFKMLYESSKGLVHLGNYSHKNINFDGILSEVIEHPLYIDLLDLEDKNKVKIKEYFTCLSIGAIRKKTERDFLLKSFREFRKKKPNSRLQICNFRIPSECVSFKVHPFKRLFFELKFRLKKQFYFFRGVDLLEHDLSNVRMKDLVLQSDVVISPRLDSLNSGIIYLALTLNKPVIGPRIGNMAEILTLLKCPSFIPNDEKTFVVGLDLLTDQQKVDQILSEYNLKRHHFSPSEVAKKHSSFYRKLLEK